MQCKKVRENLNAYLDAELRPRLQEKIDSHLQSCQVCRQAVARLLQLAVLLQDASAPPAPERFAGRVMAQARQRALNRQPSPETLLNPFLSWTLMSFPFRMAAAVVLVVGLAAGIFMGHDIWQPPAMQAAAGRQAAEADPFAVYNLDYLSDAPNGSLAQAYLTLASTQNEHGD